MKDKSCIFIINQQIKQTGVRRKMYYEEILNSLDKNVQNRIIFALLALMEEYSFTDISVSQVCQKAQVSRQTYYRFFADNNRVLIYHLNGIITEYRLIRVLTDNKNLSELSYFFLFFQNYPELLQLLYTNNKMYLLQQAISPLTDRFIHERFYKIEPYRNYADEFVAATLCSLLTVWARNEFDRYSLDIAQFASYFLKEVQ